MSRWGELFQSAYVVPDLDAALDHWTGTLGVGPFFVIPKVNHKQAIYRNRATDLDMSVAWAFDGDLQIELIRQNNDAPSIYRDFLAAHAKGGQQHVGCFVKDVEAAVAEATGRGLGVVQAMESDSGARVAYLDSTGPFTGTMVELIERHPSIVAAFEMMRHAATAWDGTNPVRTLG